MDLSIIETTAATIDEYVNGFEQLSDWFIAFRVDTAYLVTQALHVGNFISKLMTVLPHWVRFMFGAGVGWLCYIAIYNALKRS